MARMVNCVKLGREAEGMDFPPVPGELGKRLWENVSKEAWAGWLKHQTMLVNENRLNLADARARSQACGAIREDGKFVEEYTLFDEMALLKQLWAPQG